MDQLLNNYGLELGAAIAAVVTLFGLWKSLIPDDSLNKRLESLKDRRSNLLQENLTVERKQQRMKPGIGVVKGLVDRLKIMGSEHAKEVQTKLAQAGFRSREAMMMFFFLRAVLPIALGVFSAVFVYFLMKTEMQPIFKLLIFVTSICAGYYAPAIFVKNKKQHRMDAIRKGLPDALDLLVICAQAGLSLDAALTRVSNEMDASYPELSDELSLTAVELGFLQDRTEALNNINKRVDLSQMRSLISTLIQTEKYGTPLSQSLRVLAQEYRDERMMKAEEKAARLPAIMTLPMIIFILPPLFIVLLGPGILQAIDSFSKM